MKLRKDTTTMLLSGPGAEREATALCALGWRKVEEVPHGLWNPTPPDGDYARRTALCFFLARVGHTIPDKEFSSWRMLPADEQRVGAIHALPEMRGTLRATNGILALIERLDGTVFEGHLEWFVAEPVEQVRTVRPPAKPRAKRKSTLDLLLEELEIEV